MSTFTSLILEVYFDTDTSYFIKVLNAGLLLVTKHSYTVAFILLLE